MSVAVRCWMGLEIMMLLPFHRWCRPERGDLTYGPACDAHPYAHDSQSWGIAPEERATLAPLKKRAGPPSGDDVGSNAVGNGCVSGAREGGRWCQPLLIDSPEQGRPSRFLREGRPVLKSHYLQDRSSPKGATCRFIFAPARAAFPASKSNIKTLLFTWN